MPKIQILPEFIANKIAAGEVIERPASVVKELLENSIDAGANKIIVEIQNAGKKLIRVVDNGSGMTKDDLQLAFERHATSKISSLDDLFSIQTLGFRGEALSSIASVSRLELISRTKDLLSGTRIEMEGGKLTDISDYGASVGTILSVYDLFYNTPARLKFLKSDLTEIGHITSVVNQLSLAYPFVLFQLLSDGKEIFRTNSTANLKDRIINVLGQQLENQLLVLEHKEEGIQIRGYIARPNYTRKNWQQFLFFVNNRFITHRILQQAVYDSYHGFLMVGRYPVGVLFLDIEPTKIDINVHPTKREIRFSDEKYIREIITLIIRGKLQQTILIPQIQHEIKFTKTELKNTKPEIFIEEPRLNNLNELNRLNKKESEIQSILPNKTIIDHSITRKKETIIQKSKRISCVVEREEKPLDFIEITQPISEKIFPKLIPIAQLNQTYIICRSDNDLLIIDQHAAHERILFDKLLPKLKSDKPVIQYLLLPVNIELNAKESALLKNYLGSIREMGLEIDEFGGNTYVIRAVPQLIQHTDYQELLLDILDTLNLSSDKLPTDEIQYRLASVMSCHGAIKSGDTQNKPEWQTLVNQLQQTDYPYTCPHGRPTLIRLSKLELDKRFKRTGA